VILWILSSLEAAISAPLYSKREYSVSEGLVDPRESNAYFLPANLLWRQLLRSADLDFASGAAVRDRPSAHESTYMDDCQYAAAFAASMSRRGC